MCKEFSVNEEWILHGTGDMYVTSLSDELAMIAEKYNLSDNAMVLIKKYIELDDASRQAVVDFFLSIAESLSKEEFDSLGS